MQDNFSEWSIYIPFIAYNENLLCEEKTTYPYAWN